MSNTLGPRPNLEHLRKQAKDLLAACLRGEGEALARIRMALPWLGDQSPALHDAQSAVAREYGFSGWPQLVRHVRLRQTLEAARAGDRPRLTRLLQKDASLAVGSDPSDGITPLREAAAAGRAEIVAMLLERGADPNALDRGDNATPLHYACERGHLEVVKQLVEAGADVHWNQDVHELGPLGWATFFGTTHRDVAEYLIERGATLDLFSAIALGRAEDVEQIVREDPEALNRRSSACDHRKSPIEFAAEKKQFEIAHRLASMGARIGVAEAAALGDVFLIDLALQANPSSAEIDRSLAAAVAAGQTRAAERLLNAGANPNHAEGSTSVLFDAILAADRATSELLLRHGADLEWRDPQWNATPLGWAVFFGNVEACRLAISLGSAVEAHLLELAHSGERGELRAWSSGTPDAFRAVAALLSDACRATGTEGPAV